MYMGLQLLRAKIRGLQVAGISIHVRIRKASGLKRNKLWFEKRVLGSYNRQNLIAYGLLRGISYEKIEKCSEKNKPAAEKIFNIMKTHADWQTAEKLTPQDVVNLLTVHAKIKNQTAPQKVREPRPKHPQAILAEARRAQEKVASS